jgi:hypothetical protein
MPPMPMPAPQGFTSTPIPFPIPPPEPARSTKSFDMARVAAREAMIRRVIWIVALVLAVGVGVILWTQL